MVFLKRGKRENKSVFFPLFKTFNICKKFVMMRRIASHY